MRFYVATAFANKEAAREAMQLVRAAGHEVTHDWTWEDVGCLAPNTAAYNAFLDACGRADMYGVLDCDALIVLCHPDMRDTRAEMGAAIARGIPVLTVNQERAHCVFYGFTTPAHSVVHAISLAEWMCPVVYTPQGHAQVTA